MAETVARLHSIREHLAGERRRVRDLHRFPSSGAKVVEQLTCLVDDVVARLVRAALDDMGQSAAIEFESCVAVVALGGYGRAELSPYSDIDLLVLYDSRAHAAISAFARRLVQDVWDSGLQLGHAVRTRAECTQAARGDVSIHTALLEARHVVGSPFLTASLLEAVLRLTSGRRADQFVATALAVRQAEHARFGQTVHMLEPDLKRTKGGLRELHLLRWLARVKFGACDFDSLAARDVLSIADASALRTAREFLLRVRNELHFHAGRTQDALGWDEQRRIAEVFGYGDGPGELAVERFMRDYYLHSTAIADAVERFVVRSRNRRWLERWFRPRRSREIAPDILLCPGEVEVREAARVAVATDLTRTLQVFRLAQQHRRKLEVGTLDAIRQHAGTLRSPAGPDAVAVFLDILRQPGHLFETLDRMHSTRVLERLLPEFRHAHCRIQFNQYHKYTVDEHTLLAVGKAASLLGQPGAVARAYAEIKRKEVLHLAILLHDLGKGHQEDHSERGRVIARQTAEAFQLDGETTDTLVFLVHRHLAMSALAFTRDLTDAAVIARFSREVGTPDRLRMLFTLTACDIGAVGPEAWTSWKADLLSELYFRTMEQVSGEPVALDPTQRMNDARQAVRDRWDGSSPSGWLESRLEAMPRQYLLSTPPDLIVQHIKTLRTLADQDVLVESRFDMTTGAIEYTVCTFDKITPGLFSKIAGVLAAKGLQVLSAQISTHQNGVVIDRFQVRDDDYTGQPPATRTGDVSQTIRRVLLGELSVPELFRTHRRLSPMGRSHAHPAPATDVRFDNDSSDHFTIIEVFAADRQGLLYIITRTLVELGLSVYLSKITTRLDQALDVFYVERAAGKITDESDLRAIRERLTATIEQFEKTGEFQ